MGIEGNAGEAWCFEQNGLQWSDHVSVHRRVPCVSIAHNWRRKAHFVRTQYINVWSWMVESDGTGFRKCWLSLEDFSDVLDSLEWLAVTSVPCTFTSCIKLDLAQWFSGETQVPSWGLRRHLSVASVARMLLKKGFRETVSTSIRTALRWYHTQWLSNRIYLWIKREALKQVIS